MAAIDLTGVRVEDYEVLARLGGGGMGVVYEGKAPDGRRVAIKTLKPAFAEDTEVVARFLAEARALKTLSHKALVEIFSIGQLGDGTHYFVMEFLEGKTFEDVIKHGAPLAPREVLPWLVEVLDALEAVHANGVIHRDLKPSNLFLARTGVGPQVKLIDFGVAKHTGASNLNPHHTAVSAIVGTPDYMSPEQVSGSPVTAASDLYSLGCVMFEMLTGELPFSDNSEVKKMMMHVERPAPSPSTKVHGLPKEIDDVVEWMLQKDPAQRPPSAIALKRRLETMIAELGAHGAAATQVLVVPAPKVTEPEVPQGELAHREPPLSQTSAENEALRDPQPVPRSDAQAGPTRGRRRATVLPLLWVCVSGLALLGAGIAIALLTRPAPAPSATQEPPQTASPPAPAPSPADTATADSPPPADVPPPPPPPLAQAKHKRPPAAAAKRKPAAASKDKRNGR